MPDRVDLTIEGMHCDGCEITVSTALERVGLTDVEVDWRRGKVSGKPSSDFTFDDAVASIDQVGYRLVEEKAAALSETSVEADYDLLVIGAGSAAFAAAIKARDLGAHVALIERHTVGGTCVNVGCVPSKAVLRPSEIYWAAAHHPFTGISTRADSVDMKNLVAQKDELVELLRKEKYTDLADHYEFDIIHCQARFTGPDTIDIDGKPTTAGQFLIATGAEPWVPPIDGLEGIEYLTSTTALDMTELPEELIVVGANAIGLELGQYFLNLGSRVTFIEVLERIAPFEEDEISETLHAHLEAQGARILAGATVESVGSENGRVWLEVENGGIVERIAADRLLMATGRRAQTEGLGLAEAGVETDQRGHVVVDSQMRTSNPRIWAAGDVTSHPQFVYVAALGGSIAAENALRGAGREIDFRTMPRVTFTSPSVASVGLTEQEAREAGRPVVTSVLPLKVVPRALVNRETTGLIKMVADESTGELLGVHILAEGAGDVIQAAVMALKYRATVDEVAETYHPYLTMAEGLKLAAQAFQKDVEYLSCCAS
ncbi:MAG: mercury(II) reductase [Acidimicrobiia bacterium]